MCVWWRRAAALTGAVYVITAISAWLLFNPQVKHRGAFTHIYFPHEAYAFIKITFLDLCPLFPYCHTDRAVLEYRCHSFIDWFIAWEIKRASRDFHSQNVMMLCWLWFSSVVPVFQFWIYMDCCFGIGDLFVVSGCEFREAVRAAKE